MNNILLLSVAIMLAMLFLKMPVFVAVFSGSVAYFLFSPSSVQIIAQRMTGGIESVPLLAIPFFVCAGVFMNYTGVTRHIMRFCDLIIGHKVGGLAQVNVLLSTLMGGLSGSNMADTAMEAKMLVPEMERQGYSKEFSSVVTAVSSIITPLIPPGIALILYGSLANVSIGKLFVGGVGPGLLLCFTLMILVSYMSHRRGYKPNRSRRAGWDEFAPALLRAFLPLLLPFIIIGGIRAGIFTPTEAGAIAIVYALLLGLVYRELRGRDVIVGLNETVTMTASIMLIVGAASVYAWILTREQVPQKITLFIIEHVHSPTMFLVSVVAFLIIVGMFIEGNAALIILVPLLAPVARAYGFDDIHFGLVFIFTMIVGGLTPPMGTLMFITCGVTRCKIAAFIRECIPFYMLLGFCIIILMFFPFVSTGLVNWVYGVS